MLIDKVMKRARQLLVERTAVETYVSLGKFEIKIRTFLFKVVQK